MPIRLLVDIASLLPSYAADTWAQLTTAGTASYHAMWAPLLLYELAANLGYLVFSILLLVMFFQKRRSVPRLYIAVLAGSVLIRVIDIALVHTVPSAAKEITSKDWGELARALVAFAIWASYFHLSERVKATFIHGRQAEPPAQPVFAPTQPTVSPELAS